MAHPHVERRYLVVPGLRSSRVYVRHEGRPARAEIVKTIEPEEIAKKTGYSRAHTVHCGPDGIYVNALGNPDGDGPGGIFVLDHDTFEVKGAWERDRGPQELVRLLVAPRLRPRGLQRVGHAEHGRGGREPGAPARQPVRPPAARLGHEGAGTSGSDLGAEHQMTLELRPAHDPDRAYGFVGTVVSTADLSATCSCGSAPDGTFAAQKVISVPAEPAEPTSCSDALKPFGAVRCLVTDIALSVDDRSLYVSCWGTGELKRYDVSDPRKPRETGSVRIGGIVDRSPHPASGP